MVILIHLIGLMCISVLYSYYSLVLHVGNIDDFDSESYVLRVITTPSASHKEFRD
jgi:hypothetical protein